MDDVHFSREDIVEERAAVRHALEAFNGPRQKPQVFLSPFYEPNIAPLDWAASARSCDKGPISQHRKPGPGGQELHEDAKLRLYAPKDSGMEAGPGQEP